LDQKKDTVNISCKEAAANGHHVSPTSMLNTPGSVSSPNSGTCSKSRTSSRPRKTPITRNKDFFMGNSIVDDTIISENYVKCKLSYDCKQNDICKKITSEVQKIIAIDKEDKCKHM
jgi:hypothetical protein